MAVAFVSRTNLGTNTNGAAATTLDLAVSGNVTAGNWVIVTVATFDDTGAPPAGGCTKQAGTCTIGSFTRDVVSGGGAGVNGAAIYSALVSVTGTLTVRFSAVTQGFLAMGAAEFSGLKTSLVVGATQTSNGSASPESTGNVTLAASGVIIGIATEDTGADFTRTPSNNSIYQTDTASLNLTMGSQYRITNATAALTWTVSASFTWIGAGVSYLGLAVPAQQGKNLALLGVG